MPNERPATCSDWAQVERIAGALESVTPLQVALEIGPAKAAAVAKIRSISSWGRTRVALSAMENTRLAPPSSSVSARKATDEFVRSAMRVSAVWARSPTDLCFDSSVAADWTASSTSM